MKIELITMRFVENLKYLQEKVGIENIIFCGNDKQNEFLYVQYDAKNYGIAYSNLGVKAQVSIDIEEKILYIGASQNFICIDMNINKILFNNELIFPFFEMLSSKNSEYLCVVCECNVVCYYHSKELWQVDFVDIICDYKIIEDKLFVQCADKTEYFVELSSGISKNSLY